MKEKFDAKTNYSKSTTQNSEPDVLPSLDTLVVQKSQIRNAQQAIIAAAKKVSSYSDMVKALGLENIGPDVFRVTSEK
jgi:hypothetical protein